MVARIIHLTYGCHSPAPPCGAQLARCRIQFNGVQLLVDQATYNKIVCFIWGIADAAGQAFYNTPASPCVT